MFTGGVGGLVDLPNFSVLVRGTDDWSYDNIPSWQPIAEPRLLAAVRARLSYPGVEQLRPAPWLDGLDADPRGPASLVGVPVLPFPQWLRCTRCNTLAPLDSRTFGFENAKPRRPDLARFFHDDCGGRKRLAVPARFVLACVNGHLDDFPYVHFVHRGDSCPQATHPTLKMADHGGNLGANVEIRCTNCGQQRNIREAMGMLGAVNLPACRGRHPHLATFTACPARPKLLVVGASNQWFAETIAVLAVPPTGASALQATVVALWQNLKDATVPAVLDAYWNLPMFGALKRWPKDEVWAAIEQHRATLAASPAAELAGYPDLRTPEWEILTAKPLPPPTNDFAARDDAGIPAAYRSVFDDILQVERLREVRALVGFSRLDAPDPDDPDLVPRAPLCRSWPSWVPASEVRGEGLFLRLHQELLAGWEARVADCTALVAHREAFAQFRRNRYSDRIQIDFDPMRGWPGPRYIALHTLSHLLIRTIALECGYNSASLSERVYAGSADDPRGGILVYTAVPDAEGTLGGLASLGEPEVLERLLRRALAEAQRCSSDPLCAERLPQPPADFLHGAACHVCLFVSETTCERGNRFLDRRFVVPVDDPKLALLGEL
jgi:hypothetical protein